MRGCALAAIENTAAFFAAADAGDDARDGYGQDAGGRLLVPVLRGKLEFKRRRSTRALKHLGHPIRNITSVFDNLKARKPALVMQLKESGTSRQARKSYKLTVAGKQAVEMMVGPH